MKKETLVIRKIKVYRSLRRKKVLKRGLIRDGTKRWSLCIAFKGKGGERDGVKKGFETKRNREWFMVRSGV